MKKLLGLLIKLVSKTLADPWQVVRYLVGGFSAFVVDFGVGYFLYRVVQVPAGLTPLVGAPLVVSYAFSVQKFFTFKNRHLSRRQLFLYILLIVENNLISMAGLWLLVQVLGIDFRLAKFLVMGAIVANNFPLFKFLIFKRAV
jgi:putative flippase GtrA